MPDLDVQHDLAAAGPTPAGVHLVQVAVEPVDGLPADGEPATAVDPRSPLADRGHLRVRAGQFAGQRRERLDVQRAAVVQAQIDVRPRQRRTARPAAAEGDADDAADVDQPAGDGRQFRIAEHRTIVADGEQDGNRFVPWRR